MKNRDALGDRMKSFYEDRTRIYLTRKTYTIIRVDGKSFHSYTKGFERPFDWNLISMMDETAKCLCQNIMGVKFAFVQSDEISLLLTDFDKINTEAWFDNNLQKMSSVSASMATRSFNEQALQYFGLDNMKWGEFDSRVFQIPHIDEVINYFIWRQQDTTRNSISSVAQSLYSSKELHGKNQSDMQELIWQKGLNWNDYDPKLKRGRLIVKKYYEKENSTRSKWISIASPIITEDKEFLIKYVSTEKESQ